MRSQTKKAARTKGECRVVADRSECAGKAAALPEGGRRPAFWCPRRGGPEQHPLVFPGCEWSLGPDRS